MPRAGLERGLPLLAVSIWLPYLILEKDRYGFGLYEFWVIAARKSSIPGINPKWNQAGVGVDLERRAALVVKEKETPSR